MNMKNDDLDDLLGTSEEHETEPRRVGNRPYKSVSDALVVQFLARPVSISFLSKVFGSTPKTITRKLADLPPIGMHRGNSPLYDFRQAVQYLVSPKGSIKEYIKKMGPDDLPESLKKDVWDARLKEQTWRERAGDLWATEDVLEVLGDTFARLKTTSQLWVDTISENRGLSAEVRSELMKNVDALQNELHRSLVQMPKDRRTTSQLKEVEGED